MNSLWGLPFFFLLLSCCGKIEIKEEQPVEDKFVIGIFGGSVSSRIEGDTVKNEWQRRLGVQVETQGIGSAGFSSLTQNCIPDQIESSVPYDVYILWASTNDVVYAPMGGINDYDEKTQSGGIYKSVDIIKKKNSNATILFLTSLPAFNTYYVRIGEFVTSQKILCDSLEISCLDQFTLCGFTPQNYSNYYYSDTYHLRDVGYLKLLELQYDFIYENIKDKIADRNKR